jgi:hypothetical protein
MIQTGYRRFAPILAAALLFSWGCSKDEVDSEADARLAYLGLDHAVERAIKLGMAGYNAASSANIPTQSDEGELSGTMTITGQVDQGESNNKTMRLYVALDDYSDTIYDPDGDVEEPEPLDREVHYWTREDDLPYLEMKLSSIPNGTLAGTLTGIFDMGGALAGEVLLELSFTADLEPVPDTDDDIRRVAGSTVVTGTATSVYGVFDVHVIR